jgi:hypothetical protein
MIPLIPAAVLLLGSGVLFFRKKSKMTPARQIVFDTAMKDEKDPAKLTALAAEFQKEGLGVQADLLTKRAALRNLPKEVKEARKQAFKSAMSSKDKNAILGLAAAYEKETAFGAAQKLRDYAKGLP